MISKEPLISALMPIYNSQNYIVEALNGLMSQNYKNLEIIISDDCSTDDTFKVANEYLTKGNFLGKVILIKQDNNNGLTQHLNKLIKLAKGEFIVLFAGDDISLPNRVNDLKNKWEVNNYSNCAIFSNAIKIDEKGNDFGEYYNDPNIANIESLKETGNFWVGGFSLGFSKNIFDFYGDLPNDTFQEDAVFAFRALLNDGIYYIDKPTVKYRIHEFNSYKPDVLIKLILLEKSERSFLNNAIKDMEKFNNISSIDYKVIKHKIEKKLRWKKITTYFNFFICIKFFYRKLKRIIKIILNNNNRDS